ncbi:translation protein [Metschnikowia bicuspidata]|uniref:Large ribosomal subunit protein uL3m n=1 Tax=Metschnikowia bicuspidata TaxID=27322 RepID=A0A4P9ZI77_9ASCO|nr:translation protein [Metschnikowia bicuspidata]
MFALWSLPLPRASVGPKSFVRFVARIPSIHSITSVRTPTPILNHSVVKANERKQLLSRPGLLGIKRDMTSWYTEQGEQYAATIIEIDACEVLANKSAEHYGYSSVLLGQINKVKNVAPHIRSICNLAGVSPKAHLGEFRVRTDKGLIPPGVELTADYFAVGQLVDVQATTKGKGFAGVMKRHGYSGLPASHGVSVSHRSAGSMGPSQDPGRVLPGKPMAGRMGGKSATAQNLEVLSADGEAGILVVKGQIPGPKGTSVRISDAKKAYGKSLLRIKHESCK